MASDKPHKSLNIPSSDRTTWPEMVAQIPSLEILLNKFLDVLHVSWSVYETRLCDFIRPDYISPLRRVHSTKPGFTGIISQSLRCLLR